MWGVEEQGTTAIAVSSATVELAVGAIDGSVTLWDCEQWLKKLTFMVKAGGQVLALKFGSLKPSKQLLMVSYWKLGCVPPVQCSVNYNKPRTQVQVQGDAVGREDQLEVWKLPSSPDPSSLSAGAGMLDESPELLFELWSPSHNCRDLELSSSGLLAVPGRVGDVHVSVCLCKCPLFFFFFFLLCECAVCNFVCTKHGINLQFLQIWDLNESLPTSTPTPLPPLVTVDTQHPVGNIHWVSPGVIATREGIKINYWDIRAKLDSRSGRISRDTINMYSPNREISCASHVTAMAMVNELVVVGDMAGQVCVYDGSNKGKSGSPLQRFTDHKGAITDIFAVSVNKYHTAIALGCM